jgi:hypothetical protein
VELEHEDEAVGRSLCIDTVGAEEALRLGLVSASTTEPEATDTISVFHQKAAVVARFQVRI